MYSVITSFEKLSIADLEKAKDTGYFHCSSISFLFKIHLVVRTLLLPIKNSSFNTYFEMEETSCTNIKTALCEPNSLPKWVILWEQTQRMWRT